ncbi:hypothetical protein [Bacteriovorax sp. Seq25_V]|uniref:hypothetical protein n=1 Tax=Bacteriovorax sp. Seq25_V TaxID=1201288 RepID=UPI00038A55BA|nr:hypothetical protein [Bacteriovorax sp. Seq25_V]EQC47970.1 hypothetical protein M900_A0073 [Bacteriovorax sp. Seq25_V]
MKLVTTLIFVLITSLSYSAVWEATNSWDMNYEEEYSNWIKSSNVNETMFIDPKSPYYGIKADCADAAYALRAIFSFEHSLPFAVKNPSGSRGKIKTFNNELNNWDKYGAPNKKLVAMINTIGASVGSENLTYFDSYPIELSSTNAGSLFTYKIKARNGNFIRHVYNIKNINPVGTFDTIYSTQAIKAAGEPMTRRKSKEFVNLPHDPWGFKRLRWPEHIGVSINSLPEELNASNHQFKIAQDLGSKKFFAYVKTLLKTEDEDPANKLYRALTATCEEAVARIKYVDQALLYLSQTGNKCMDYRDFDTYSTPARDKALTETFVRLKDTYTELEKNGELSRANPEHVQILEAIFKNVHMPEADLLKFCSVNYSSSSKISLKELWRRINNGLLSSHPNDTVELRWGEKTGPKTSCKRWY